MKLEDAIDSIHVKSVVGSLDLDIKGVSYDSRKVSEGDVFCALTGLGADGNEFVDAAVESGAVAVISEKPNPAEFPVTWLQVRDARSAMGGLASNLQGHPGMEMPVIGVTGTNGKTTTSFLIHYLLESILRRAGLIGTIHYSNGDGIVDAPHTTPESPDLHRLLREMRNHDCRGAVMEVSSHGLSQKRVEGVPFDVGVFANLTQDHLDYHGTMEEYFGAKRVLFEMMDADSRKKSTALINVDDAFGDRLNKERFENLTKFTYGRSANADFRASDLKSDFNGTSFTLSFKERKFLVRIPLIGDFNVSNAVAAIASAYAVGLNLREVISKMPNAPQVPGRLEVVGNRQISYRVFVDYAHTPDALRNVLSTLRALEPARIITVFGCGGDRDVTKRPLMARAAEEGSDYCVLTSDNPRTEDPAGIIVDAEKGFQGSNYEAVEDRASAIETAINLAGERDIVLIAGKGHEPYQEINGVRHDFDDRKVASRVINEKAERGGK
ncbi:MAG: UDP-N-acetylmuramoyl-L-alanyl-D-glutamate--2,6-diaminopimelate ligase [Verrucomicrobiales bacterium]|nr:UDP-N-acetylmuramoyl-L-alanyl-D-glutamate--2,6-diaminopimelate ligase [Verrucomicrobiales bacterium]